MTNLNHHYKNRNPQETVQIIKNFFKQNNYNIYHKDLKETDVSTWGCVVFLYYDDILIQKSNGKGMTKKYALASGYAELYERFCNKIAIYRNPFLNKYFMENNYEKNHFYFHKDEKEVTYEEMLNLEDLQYYFKNFTNNNEEYLKKYIDFLTNSHYIQVPYKNYINGTIKYINPILLTFLLGSNGMSAGNTFEEAYNQGICELYERYAIMQLVDNQNIDTIYKIKLSSIKNKKLLDIISLIEKDDNIIQLYDFSYNFNIPVVGGFLFNKSSKTNVTILGSFPVFDIALERVLTEMYQNRKSYKNYKNYLPSPQQNFTKDKAAEQLFSTTTQNIFLDIFFDKNEIEIDYNKDFYLSPIDYSLKTIFDWNNELCKKNNFDIYVKENSLIPEMSVCQLYSPTLSNLWKFLNFSQLDSLQLKKEKYCLDFAINYFKYMIEYLNNNSLDYSIFINKIMKMWDTIFSLKDEQILKLVFHFLGGKDTTFFTPFGSFGSVNNYKDFIIFLLEIYKNDSKKQINSNITSTFLILKKDIIKYLILQNTNINYSYKSLQKMFSLFNEELSLEEYQNRQNSVYILYKILFELYKKRYNKENLKKCLEGFLPKCDMQEL